MAHQTLSIDNQEQIRGLFGCQDQFLKRIREQLGVQVVVRGEEIRLSGTESQVSAASDVFRDLQLTLERHGEVFPADVEQALGRLSGPAGIEESPVAETAGRSTPADSQSADSMSTNLSETRAQRPRPGTFRADRPVDESRSAREPSLSRSPAGAQSLDDSSINLFEKARRVKPRTPGQAQYVDAIRENDLVFCTGPAGCGKTYLAVAMGLNALRTEQVRKIVLVRPAVEAGEKLGFLPGDLLAKVNPYLRPLLDALADILSFDQVKRYMEHDIIEIVPLAYMRGRTLNDTFIILDEAQNTTATQMKMFLTRMGEHSKIVVTGDPTQVDLPGHMLSGLKDATKRLEGIPGVEAVRLSGQDIVRHRLVREIVRAYDADDQSPSGAHSRRK